MWLPWNTTTSLCGLWHRVRWASMRRWGRSLARAFLEVSHIMPGRNQLLSSLPPCGWEIYEQGIYGIARTSKKIMAISNGCWRRMEWESKEERFRRWLLYSKMIIVLTLSKAICANLTVPFQEGARLYWLLMDLIDCMVLLNSYNRYGLIELNLETQERIIKKSCWLV